MTTKMTFTGTFTLGVFVMTRTVNDSVASCTPFAKLAWQSLARHANCDWGDLQPSDKRENNNAVREGGRILSAYKIPPEIAKAAGVPDMKLWIITEADRSVTTLLFPSEY